MNVAEFASLDMVARSNAICKKGVYLCGRHIPHYGLFLYAIDGFYVEVYYHQQKRKVTELKSFTDTAYLEPYLQDIDLTALLEDTTKLY